MADPRICQRRLTIENQADSLNGFDREGLMSLNQGAVMREVVHADRVAGIECSPERPEDLKPNPGPTISRCSHLWGAFSWQRFISHNNCAIR